MKTVFSSKELPHIWANQSAPEGRSASALSFGRRSIFSYSTEIGRILEPMRAVVLNRRSYSNTTSKHQSRVAVAVNHFAHVFEFEADAGRSGTACDVTGQELHEYYLRRSAEYTAKAKRARTNGEWLTQQAVEAVKDANRVREYFKLRVKPVSLDPATLDGIAERMRKLDAKKTREQKKREAEQAEARRQQHARELDLAREGLADWRNGASLGHISAMRFPELFPATPEGFQPNAALRLNADASRVETTQGAQVLVRTVRFLWEFCAQARASQTAVAPEIVERFPRLDSYSANAIDQWGNLSAGCHQIAFAEIESIARALNLPPFNGEAAQAPQIPSVETVNS